MPFPRGALADYPQRVSEEAVFLPEGSQAPLRRAPSWDEISPETLREHAEAQGADPVAAAGTERASGIAWFEAVLGLLLGLSGTLAAYQMSDGGLGPSVVVPAAALGVILWLVPRPDIRNLGLGLLWSVPAAALLGLGMWYLAQFL